MTNQIVVFELQGQHYGAEIEEIKEIIHMQPITDIPSGFTHAEGVINLRGNLCSIVNGRSLLGLSRRAAEETDKIVVLDGGKIGVIVDDVFEILTLEEKDKKSVHGMDKLEVLDFIHYLVETDKRIIIVLKLKQMLVPNTEETENVAV